MIKKPFLLFAILVLFLSGCSILPPQPTLAVPTLQPPQQTPAVPTLKPAQKTLAVPYQKHIIGYYPSWAAGRGVFLKDIPYAQLTHINYAFSDVSQNGECALGDPSADIKRAYSSTESISGQDDPPSLPYYGNFNQIRQLKEQVPNLKVLISIGGWTLSGNFSNAAADDASRKHFATSCIDLYLKQYQGVFDGLDIDWEYPVNGGLTNGKSEDKKNYTLLLAEIRRQLDELGKTDNRHYLLSIAAPIGPGIIRNFEPGNIAVSVDWINLMAYDFHGTWEKSTNFNAPLFGTANDPGDSGLNVDAAVQSYIFVGVPPQKIVLGVPFYGHGWSGVLSDNNGLYKSASGAAPGKFESGSFTYKEITADYLPSFQRFWNEDAHVPWLYDPSKQIFISYDDPKSIEAKAGYARDQALAGIMIWDVSQGDQTLIDAIYKGFEVGGPTAPTPESPSSKPRPFEAEIHSVSKITLDGELNDWTAKPDFVLNDQSQVVYSLDSKSWAGPSDLSANIWLGWTPDGLYGAFKVVDDIHLQTTADSSLWHGDYMEMQFDTRLESDYGISKMDDDDYQIGLSVGDFASIPPVAYAWFNGPAAGGPISQIKMAFKKTSDGYNLEVFIPKEALVGITLAEESTFGMNVNPSDADNATQGQKVMLSTSRIRTYADPRTFGKITLVK